MLIVVECGVQSLERRGWYSGTWFWCSSSSWHGLYKTLVREALVWGGQQQVPWKRYACCHGLQPIPQPSKTRNHHYPKAKNTKKNNTRTLSLSLSLSLFLSVSEIATGLGLCVCDLKPLQEAGEDVLAQSSRQFPGPQTATVELLLLLSSDEEETRPSTLTTTQHKKTDKTKNPKSNSCGWSAGSRNPTNGRVEAPGRAHSQSSNKDPPPENSYSQHHLTQFLDFLV